VDAALLVAPEMISDSSHMWDRTWQMPSSTWGLRDRYPTVRKKEGDTVMVRLGCGCEWIFLKNDDHKYTYLSGEDMRASFREQEWSLFAICMTTNLMRKHIWINRYIRTLWQVMNFELTKVLKSKDQSGERNTQ
jgi:hypothetical protein